MSQENTFQIRSTGSPFKKVVIYSGGTMVHVRPHFSLCAPAYGAIGKAFAEAFDKEVQSDWVVENVPTKMAGGYKIETNDDLQADLERHLRDPSVKAIIMAAAICDFEPNEMEIDDRWDSYFGKGCARLSSEDQVTLHMVGADKIIDRIKQVRPDIHLTSFKTTSGKSNAVLLDRAQKNMVRSQSDIVFGNDIENKHNLLSIAPDGLAVGTRQNCVETVVKLVIARLQDG